MRYTPEVLANIQSDAVHASQQQVSQRRTWNTEGRLPPSDWHPMVWREKHPFNYTESLRFPVWEEGEYGRTGSDYWAASSLFLREFLQRLNSVEVKDGQTLVIDIGTGGTIAGTGSPLRPTKKIWDLITPLSDALPKDFVVVSCDAGLKDGGAMIMDEVGDLAIYKAVIADRMPEHLRAHFAGFVHYLGTDNQDRTCAHNTCMLGGKLPFSDIQVGAHSPIDMTGSSARHDMILAHHLLRALHQQGKAESLFCMNGRVMLSVGTEKVRSTDIASPLFHVVLDVSDDPCIAQNICLPSWLRDRVSVEEWRDGVVIYRGPSQVGFIEREQQPDIEACIARMRGERMAAYVVTLCGGGPFDEDHANAIVDMALQYRMLICPRNPLPDAAATDLIYAASPFHSRRNLGSGVVYPIIMSSAMAVAKIHRILALHPNALPKVTGPLVQRDLCGEVPQASAQFPHLGELAAQQQRTLQEVIGNC